MDYSYSFLILLLPLLSFLLLGLLGMKMKKPVAGYIGTAVLLSLWGMSLYTAYKYFF
jgi:NADH-quinone oxidoreductase subunit L